MSDSVYPHGFPHGFRYEVHTTVTETDVYLWAGLMGEPVPIRRTSAFARHQAGRRSVVQHAFLTGLIVSTAGRMLAYLPPPGAVLVALTVQFTAPVFIGTTLVVVGTMIDWDAAASLYWLDIRVVGADGTPAVTGKLALHSRTTQLADAI